MSTIANLTIFPMDKGINLSTDVASVIKIIRDSGLPYQFGPMSTAIEGEYDDVMKVVRNCFKELEKKSERVYMTLAIDYRKSTNPRMKAKIQSVEEKL